MRISSSIQKLLLEGVHNAVPQRTLTAKEREQFTKLLGIDYKLISVENVQNLQLQPWRREDEYTLTEFK